jgi:hyperosmotically inducible periplasmic protein
VSDRLINSTGEFESMKKVISYLAGCALILSLAACSTAKTSADAPNSTNSNGQAPATDTAQTNKGDAENGVRQAQLDSDIRAREQRNDAGGDQEKRADGDLASEVRSKLEANIHSGNLAVEAKNGVVTVAGTVPTQEQFNKIEPLAKEIKGVQSVEVKATIAPAQNK